jgi:hypothetical protein
MFYTKGDKQDFVKKRKMKTLMFVKGKNWKKKNDFDINFDKSH